MKISLWGTPSTFASASAELEERRKEGVFYTHRPGIYLCSAAGDGGLWGPGSSALGASKERVRLPSWQAAGASSWS